MTRLAVLYDIHGNLVALDAVVAEAEGDGVTSYVLGGDYATFGPWPRETVDRLRELPVETWIRGKRPEVPAHMRAFVEKAVATARSALADKQVEQLHALPAQADLGGVLYCHGSPLSDIESFSPDAAAGDERLLAGVGGRTVVFGHSHIQFARDGPHDTYLINPGSVGQPLDGDRRAAWAVWDERGLTFRRTQYDVEQAVAEMSRLGKWAEPLVGRLERARG
jgi:diadenosine tetraphosphatase ApaH/serine/threonine PP2A family protein phosphatase